MEQVANENNNSLISFNNLIIDFLNDLLSTFPEYEVDIKQNLDKIKVNIETKDYIKLFKWFYFEGAWYDRIDSINDLETNDWLSDGNKQREFRK